MTTARKAISDLEFSKGMANGIALAAIHCYMNFNEGAGRALVGEWLSDVWDEVLPEYRAELRKLMRDCGDGAAVPKLKKRV